MRGRGSITVYLSLVLVLMMALLFTLLESARVRGLQVDADRMTQAASESVFAEYSRALLEEYDLFFLDASYGADSFSEDDAAARIMTFLEMNADADDADGGTVMDLFSLVPESAQIESYQLATDDNGAAYYEMACTYAQSALPASALSDLMSYLTGGEESSDDSAEESVIDEALSALDDDSNYGEEENAELTEEEIAAADEVTEETKGILETVRELKEKGILALLVEDADDLSSLAVTASDLVSGRELLTGTETLFDGDGSRLLFQWYLGEKFSCFTDEAKERALLYELEYCYAGEDSDLENLSSVAEALLLIREGVNYAYLLTDTEKKEEARIVALAITGIFAVPALLTAVQSAVLFAWAFLESVKDVQMLLAGDTVPVTKTSQNWQTSLSVSSITDETGSTSSAGLTYENYLQVLLLTRGQSTLISRSMDLIEQNVRLTEGNESFQLDHCIAGASWSVTWSGSAMFLALTQLTAQQSMGEYHFDCEGAFRYE